ncbi:MAG: hypothetical protein CMP34_00340 [Rickettsiales bacterium]|nr:hypothetical protein [Rickettsiales bacterium]|tara:strand:- start:66 stop:287 length:222 start_codon:yes stop_codon:yes gene_type:complete
MIKKSQELIWIDEKEKVISCDETNKVLNENYYEILSVLQNAFDDAIILGCNEKDVRLKFAKLVSNMRFSLGKK